MRDELRDIQISDRRPLATAKSNFSGAYSRDIISSIAAEAIRQGVDPYTALAVSLQENNLGKKQGVGWGCWDTQSSFFDNPRHRSMQRAMAEEQHPIRSTVGKLLSDRASKYTDQMREMDEKGYGGSPQWEDLRRARNTAWGDAERVNYSMEQMPATSAFNAARFVSTLGDKLKYGRTVYGQSIPESKAIQAYHGYGMYKSHTTGRIIDAAEEQPYGRRILALRRHAIANNPEIRQLVNALKSNASGLARK